MRYYKVIKGGMLQLIGTGAEGGEEISREEYDSLFEEIKNTPITLPEVGEEESTDGSD